MKIRTIKPALFDVELAERGPRRTSSEAIELSPSRLICPSCAFQLRVVETGQAALLWLHGFGGTVVTAALWCRRCGYHRHHSTRTVTPR